jgi:Uma2 family endonuclease
MVFAITEAAIEAKPYTAEEYLALEVESDTRHEYRNGEMLPMTGGTPVHNQIAVVFNALLWIALRGKAYGAQRSGCASSACLDSCRDRTDRSLR